MEHLNRIYIKLFHKQLQLIFQFPLNTTATVPVDCIRLLSGIHFASVVGGMLLFLYFVFGFYCVLCNCCADVAKLVKTVPQFVLSEFLGHRAVSHLMFALILFVLMLQCGFNCYQGLACKKFISIH